MGYVGAAKNEKNVTKKNTMVVGKKIGEDFYLTTAKDLQKKLYIIDF